MAVQHRLTPETSEPGTSFIGMHVTYVEQMRLYYRERHSWVLDTATARVGLMSQRASVA